MAAGFREFDAEWQKIMHMKIVFCGIVLCSRIRMYSEQFFKVIKHYTV